jgi:rhodanese-related sulfurtransferase
MSLPVGELSRRLRELPNAQQMATYCRGPHCVYADDAVRTLRRKGFRAARLEDGCPEWERAGLPLAT